MRMIFLSGMFPWPTVISAPGEEFTASSGRGVSRTSSRDLLTFCWINTYKLNKIKYTHVVRICFVCFGSPSLIVCVIGKTLLGLAGGGLFIRSEL